MHRVRSTIVIDHKNSSRVGLVHESGGLGSNPTTQITETQTWKSVFDQDSPGHYNVMSMSSGLADRCVWRVWCLYVTTFCSETRAMCLDNMSVTSPASNSESRSVSDPEWLCWCSYHLPSAAKRLICIHLHDLHLQYILQFRSAQ